MMIEDLCNQEDAQEYLRYSRHFERINAGKDIQNHFNMNYLTNEQNI